MRFKTLKLKRDCFFSSLHISPSFSSCKVVISDSYVRVTLTPIHNTWTVWVWPNIVHVSPFWLGKELNVESNFLCYFIEIKKFTFNRSFNPQFLLLFNSQLGLSALLLLSHTNLCPACCYFRLLNKLNRLLWPSHSSLPFIFLWNSVACYYGH